MAGSQTWKKMMAAGELTDLPGHCKLCGADVESEDHPMHDPRGFGDPLFFCSAECLHDAEHIFDGLAPEKLRELGKAIAEAESKVAKIHH